MYPVASFSYFFADSIGCVIAAISLSMKKNFLLFFLSLSKKS
ncbi:hypothetical protein FDUTEX481_02816 [Tolypothrix sp. PCC 7601]|nr:hypothetical protein FDUTEX481_02816 [Tolypothrix sp. PCC 7601]